MVKVKHTIFRDMRNCTSIEDAVGVGNVLWRFNMRGHGDNSDIFMDVYGNFVTNKGSVFFRSGQPWEDYAYLGLHQIDWLSMQTYIVGYTEVID